MWSIRLSCLILCECWLWLSTGSQTCVILFDYVWGWCVRCETKDGVTHTHIYLWKGTDKCTDIYIEGDESLRSVRSTGLQAAFTACLHVYECELHEQAQEQQGCSRWVDSGCLRGCVRELWHCL